MQKKEALQKIYENFQARTGYGIVIGVEQEFYLGGGEERENGKELVREEEKKEDESSNSSSYSLTPYPLPTLPSPSLITSLAAFPFFSEIEEEKGEGQFEIQIYPTDNPAVMAEMVEILRKKVCSLSFVVDSYQRSTTNDKQAFFEAKPYPNQPGSGLHINVNLTDYSGNNLFTKNGEEESKILEYAIAGLLELMPASMKYFAPYEAAYIRHTEQGMESPSTISWGGDNRTVSLRIPSVPLNPYARRIEHRVPCADSDPYFAIAAIVAGMEFGIVNKLVNSHPKVFGNAFLPQYSLPKLPMSFKEAQNISHEYLDMVMNKMLNVD